MKLPLLLIGIAGGLAAVLALAPATGTALGQLASARNERVRLEAVASQPGSADRIVAEGMGLSAADAAAGRGAIMARVQRLARTGGVLVEETSAVEVPEGLAGLRIRISGAEKAVLALADKLERERPLVRLATWRIEPVNGGVRLTGRAMAAWR
jgi:hypothetical protein